MIGCLSASETDDVASESVLTAISSIFADITPSESFSFVPFVLILVDSKVFVSWEAVAIGDVSEEDTFTLSEVSNDAFGLVTVFRMTFLIILRVTCCPSAFCPGSMVSVVETTLTDLSSIDKDDSVSGLIVVILFPFP